MKVSLFTLTAFTVTVSIIAFGDGVSARSVKHPRVGHADLTKKNQIQSLYVPPASKRGQVIQCSADLHRCDDGTECILQSWLCDGGKPDCDDGSDERNCDSTLCYPGRFKCNNTGKCVTSVFRCDGKDDCGDESDEVGCPPIPCPPMHFKCDDKTRYCIHESSVCDGLSDCPDSSDEFNCSTRECLPGRVKCNNSYACIPESWICDSINDCPNASDEQECPLLPRGTTEFPELYTEDAGTIEGVIHFSTPKPNLEVDTEDQQLTNNEAPGGSSDDAEGTPGCDEEKNDSIEKEALEEILDVLHHTNGRDISVSNGRKHHRRANHAARKKNH